MTNDKKNNDKTNQDKDLTVGPRSAADSTSADSTAADSVASDAATGAENIAPGSDRETISLEEAGLRHEGRQETQNSGTESGASRAAGVLLIVLLTLIAAGAGAALGPLIHCGDPGNATLGALDSRLTTLEGTVAELSGLSGRLASLDQSAAGLEERVATLESAPVATADGQMPAVDLSDINQRIGALENGVSALASRVDGALDQQLQRLDERLVALEGGPSAATGEGAASAEAPTSAEVENLRTSLAELSARIDALAGDAAAIDALRSRLAEIDARLAGLDETAAAIETLRDDVATLNERAADPRAAFALAVGQLREAVLAGGGYRDVLATAVSLAPDDTRANQALASLHMWDGEGVATRARLADALSAAAHAAVDQSRREAAQGWFDKTVAELASIVSIRRVDGESGSDSADDVTARAEARLRQGDLSGAIAEMASLTGAAAEAAAGWLEMARAREAAEQAIDTLSARALALVGGVAG